MAPPRRPAPSNDPAATTLAARTPEQPALPAILNDKIEQAAAYARAARAGATRRAYESDWAIFTAWCAAHRLVALPATPEVVAVFASDQAVGGLNPATIGRRIAAIGHYHRAGGHPAPTALPTAGRLAEVLAGIRAEHGGAKLRKQPADAAALRNMLAAIEGDGLRALRDRAILAVGMAAALRRSEIVALGVEHVGLVPEGLRLTIARSKTDRTGAGAVIAIPEGSRIRPKALLLAWMAAAGHAAGPLFRRLSRSDALTEDAIMADRRDRPAGPAACRRSRLRSDAIRRPLAARRLPDRGRGAGRDDLQAAGGQPPQIGAGPVRLRARCRAVPRSRGAALPIDAVAQGGPEVRTRCEP
jgi:integrase